MLGSCDDRLSGAAHGELPQLHGQVSRQEQFQDSQPGPGYFLGQRVI